MKHGRKCNWEGFKIYAQGEKTLGDQSSGVFRITGSVSPFFLASATASAYVSPRPTTRDSSADKAIQRRDIFERAYKHDDSLDKSKPGSASRVAYNMVLCGRAKKNFKTGDLVLWSLYKLICWLSWSGNQCYILANDEDQAGDDLELAKKILTVNPGLADLLIVKQNIIERKDGKGFLEILPAGDVVGTHGKTYLLCAFDEIHGYKDWSILEAMQLDPSRPDAQMWLTS